MQIEQKQSPEQSNNTSYTNHMNASSSDSSNAFSEAAKEEAAGTDDHETLSGGQSVEEVANNDGSIIETLDTAFHNEPGMIKDHSMAGSNRADYYESRSTGKTDAEEELDALKKQPE